MKLIFILIILILLLVSGCAKQKDSCAEKIYSEALRFAEIIPKDMPIGEAMKMADGHRKQIISRLDFAMKLYC